MLNILIINGSPKGKNSITLQTTLYLQKRFPQYNFNILNVTRFLNDSSKEAMLEADLIIFSYPVYTCLVPYQLHRYIELIKESKITLTNKFATQITTSKHFYDVTAHKFIEQNCYDLGLKYIKGLSADMEDLQKPHGRSAADDFFEKVIFNISHEIYSRQNILYTSINKVPYKSTLPNRPKKTDKDIVLITNVKEDDTNLKNMIRDFKNGSLYDVREINIRNFPFQGGCIGCFKCTIDGTCIYKDNFSDLLSKQIHNADAIFYAFTIEDHYTHSSFKCFEDRQFANGHRVLTKGKITGYIISGDYQNETNIQTIVQARSDIAKMYLAGVATDEGNTKKDIINLINSTTYALKHNLNSSKSFYSVGGSKIFRDLVFQTQGFMQADHKFYKQTGEYDFPHKNISVILGMKVLGMLISSEQAKKYMPAPLSEYMLMPYKKVIDKTCPKK
ncbi:MAG: iron-sulfur protein [Epulopiscium sp. Nuni2H_MBin003]|nr:MAG: iron-sulfur protein [Epulopiscium sp. Nuni2H_MBin003]